MDPDELFEKVRHRPFEPFRIHVSDGTSYEVKHPDQIMVGRRSSHVGLSRNGEGPFQKIAIVANIHIARIEPLGGKRQRKAGG
jgi:hypothetical protein